MQIKLYYAPIACSLVPLINLTEANATFETVALNMAAAHHMAPDYVAINPKHKVPMLAIDGELLTENVAINIWIARTFPAAKLLPAGSMPEIQAVSLMNWFGSGIHPHLARINSPSKFATGADQSVKDLAAGFLDEAFGIADHKLAGREFFFDHFTAVDSYFFWCWRRATQFKLPLTKFANCAAHYARMEQRPSVQKALAFEASTLAKFAA
jgi:glutathione S-transferase